MHTKSIVFKIEKCKGHSDCKSHEEILEFVKDLYVQFWLIESSMDFQNFNDKSLKRNQKLIL